MATIKNFKPILFSTEMVQAILAGRKTQTRRIVKPQPSYFPYTDSKEGHEKTLKSYINAGLKNEAIKGKYQFGNILWVRETFYEPLFDGLNGAYYYKADLEKLGWEFKWKPSLFMPKEAARIFLKVTNVRCERLQDISEEDAIAEGIDCHTDEDGKLQVYCYPVKGKDKTIFCDSYISEGIFNLKDPAAFSFQKLWDSINAKKHPWESNPWVWVYDFEVIDKPEDFN